MSAATAEPTRTPYLKAAAGIAAALAVLWYMPAGVAADGSLPPVSLTLLCLTSLVLVDVLLGNQPSVPLEGVLIAPMLSWADPFVVVGCAVTLRAATSVGQRRATHWGALSDAELGALSGLGSAAATMMISARLPGAPLSARVLVAAAAYYLIAMWLRLPEGAGVQIVVLRRSVQAKVLGDAPLAAAYCSCAALAAMLGARMGAWALPILLVLAVVCRWSQSLLNSAEAAYAGTLDVILGALLEDGGALPQDTRSIPEVCRRIGAEVGLGPLEITALENAAKLSMLADPNRADVLRLRTQLGGVAYLAPAVQVLDLCIARPGSAAASTPRQRLSASALILAWQVCAPEALNSRGYVAPPASSEDATASVLAAARRLGYELGASS